MQNKHEQLQVVVQDLLTELGISSKRLEDIAANRTHSFISPRIARKLVDIDLTIPKKESVGNMEPTLPAYTALSMFDKIKADLAPGTLWTYLREKHPEFLCDQIKDYLFPSQ